MSEPDDIDYGKCTHLDILDLTDGQVEWCAKNEHPCTQGAYNYCGEVASKGKTDR